ncbi:Uncharacterised protein [Mycobacteroides abscessus subsp. abscessus]|nr:Uncharacterised protein [Mycobacteroides abscessus subsp. abscessus]
MSQKGIAQRCDDRATGRDLLASLGVDRQVEVSCTHPGFGVGKALALVGERVQAFADDPPRLHQDRSGAVVRLTHDAAGLDQITQIDGGGELFVQPRIVDKQLHLRGPIP